MDLHGSLEEIASVQEDCIGILVPNLLGLVNETSVAAETIAVVRVLFSASPAVFVSLLETAVNVVCVQNGQIE